MRRVLNDWRWATLRNGFQDATAYRTEFLIGIIGSALVPAAIQWIVWFALFQAGGETRIDGHDFQYFVHYTLMSLLFSQVRGGDHDFELQEMIRSGSLSQYLLRPVSVVQFIYVRGVAPRLFIAGVCLLLGFILRGFISFPIERLLGAMLLALLGNLIHYQIGATLAALAFYWEESYYVLMVKNLIVSLLSGEMIPLTLFPKAVSLVWKSTPFYLYVFAPTQYALGRRTGAEFVFDISIGVVWLLITHVGLRLSWRVGMRRYLSLGG